MLVRLCECAAFLPHRGVELKKLTVPVLNLLLAFGVVCILVGIFLLVRVASNYRLELSFLTLALVFTGALLFYLSLTVYRRALLFFLGMYLCFASVANLITASGLLPFSTAQLWPLQVVLSGICLIVTGLFKNRRVTSRYLFPAILLAALGCIFMLFSLDVIPVSFASVFTRWWPVLLVGVGGFLVALFLYQQSPDSRFPYEAEDSAEADASAGVGDSAE